jgi:hypothetical protein
VQHHHNICSLKRIDFDVPIMTFNRLDDSQMKLFLQSRLLGQGRGIVWLDTEPIEPITVA